MGNVRRLGILFLGFLFASCQSISQSRAELGIPQSVVILNFDDGPNARDDTTARILDVLEQHDIQALFCLLGVNAEHNPQLVRRIYNEGHYIINHGYSDIWAVRLNDDDFRVNLALGEEAISAALGHDWYPKLYRPHSGFYTLRQEKILRDEGYTLVPVNVRIYDAVLTRAEQSKAVKRIIKKIQRQDGGILLLHDERGSYSRAESKLAKKPAGAFNRSWIPGTVEEIIPVLLDKGFTLGGFDILSAIGFDD